MKINILYLLKKFGIKFILFRLWLLIRNKSGFNKVVFRNKSWDDILLSDIIQQDHDFDTELGWFGNRFLFPLGSPLKIPDRILQSSLRNPDLQERIKALKCGRCTCFFNHISSDPIKWHTNFLNGKQSNPDISWFQISDYVPEQRDPRFLWEPSRAAWAIDIARAQARGILTDGRELFWKWVDSWMQDNPPFRGFQWKCGQESAVRFMALCFGFWCVESKETLTSERYRQFARLAWATGYRIYHHINYAISQKNNHPISEACGLLLISHLFPQFKDTINWRKKGRTVLENELRKQIYKDGSYVQQSFNYQRVMMQGALLALRIAEIEDEPFPDEIYDLMDICVKFMYQMMDEKTGLMPQYGANDGAWILPLNECEFWDFRPLIQSVHYLVHRNRLFESGPWDEDLLWLFGEKALGSPVCTKKKFVSSRFDTGGYYTIRDKDSWCMMRCHTYKDRPYHADQLHVDLWYKGNNVLRDCGSYQYYIPDNPDLENYFDSARAHNVIQIDQSEPMEKASRFMKFPWTRSSLTAFKEHEQYTCFTGEFYGYNRKPWKVILKRTVLNVRSNIWIIIDDVIGKGNHTSLLMWHLMNGEVFTDPAEGIVQWNHNKRKMQLQIFNQSVQPRRFEIINGSDKSGTIQGWASDYYGSRKPIPVLEAEFTSELPLRLITSAGFDDNFPIIELYGKDLNIKTSRNKWHIELFSVDSDVSCIIKSVQKTKHKVYV